MVSVYRKTAKGQSEIETRAHRLTPRQRSALILVDGKRSSEDLRKLVLQEPDQILGHLLHEGFIEVIAELASATPAAALAPAAPVAAPAEATPRPKSIPFEQTRRDAVHALTDLVGPLGEALAIRMERARHPGELRPLIVVAQQVIANTRGQQAANGYGTRFSLD